jgi:predicted ester cyclase
MIKIVPHRHAIFLAAALLATAAPTASSAQPQTNLTPDQARRIVAPLYDALNQPLKKDVSALLSQAANPDYLSCSTNQDCLGRDALVSQFKVFGAIIPDLRWTIQDIWTEGNRIVVRGEASGTPVQPLFGVKPSGKSFRTISIDMFTVQGGKLSSAYHVENWAAAMQQISTKAQTR